MARQINSMARGDVLSGRIRARTLQGGNSRGENVLLRKLRLEQRGGDRTTADVANADDEYRFHGVRHLVVLRVLMKMESYLGRTLLTTRCQRTTGAGSTNTTSRSCSLKSLARS